MRTEVKLITPDLARIYLEKNSTNRPLREKTVNFYADQMNRNLWRLTGQGLSFDINGKLLDGQHRLEAIIKSKKSIQFLVIFDVDPQTFDVYDSGKNRSNSDIFNIEGIANATHISSSIQKYLMFKYERKYVTSSKALDFNITKHDLIQIYYENSDIWININKSVGSCYTKLRIYTLTTMCGFAAYLIIDKKKEMRDVLMFFRELTGLEKDKYTCTKSLRDAILKNSLESKKISEYDKIGMMIKTWNFYSTKRDVTYIRHVTNDKYQDII